MSWDTSPKTGLFYVLLTSKGGNIVSRGQKRAFTTQGFLNTSLIIESCTLSIFPQQHNRIEFGVSSLANKLHLASKNLQNKHLITVGTGFGNTRAPKTHHTMRNSRRLARYKAHGFFLAPRRHWDALTKHAGRINYKNGMERTRETKKCSLVEDWPQHIAFLPHPLRAMLRSKKEREKNKSEGGLPSPPLLFIAIFTSHRSPLSERLERANNVSTIFSPIVAFPKGQINNNNNDRLFNLFAA